MESIFDKLPRLPYYKRVVHKHSFLKNVQWLFSYSAIPLSSLEHLGKVMTDLGFVRGEEDSIDQRFLLMTKDSLQIIINDSLAIVNCSGKEYEGFDAFFPSIVEVLALLEQVGVSKIEAAICMKTNSFMVDKEKFKESLSIDEFNTFLFSKEYLSLGPERVMMTGGSDCLVYLQRDIKDSVTRIVVELRTQIVSSRSFAINDSITLLREINGSSYSAWRFAMSPLFFQLLEKEDDYASK